MSDAMLTFPADVNPCAATDCASQTAPVTACWAMSCPYTWARQSREDRARREEKDRKRMRDDR